MKVEGDARALPLVFRGMIPGAAQASRVLVHVAEPGRGE